MEKFNVFDEISPLKCLCLCRASYVPEFDSFADDPVQSQKFKMQKWNKEKLIIELENFYELLHRYNVNLKFYKNIMLHYWNTMI